MQAASVNFQRAVRESHTAVAKMEIIRGSLTTVFRVVDGSTTFDFDDTTRRSLDVTFVDDGNRTFDAMRSLNDPYTSILKVYRGVKYSNGTEEYMLLGTFYVDTLDIAERDGAVGWQLSALDASSMCQRPMEFPVFIPAGMAIGNAIPQVLRQVMPTLGFHINNTPWTTPAVLIQEDANPWEEATKLANAAGMDLFIDRTGICVLGSRPSVPAVTPNWYFEEGVNATFWDVSRNLKSKPANVIVVLGTNTLTPGIRGEAKDNDPASPTYVNGSYGRVVKTLRSELAITTDQAMAMAQRELTIELGPSDETTFTCIPNPAMDEADTIAVTRAKLGMNKRQVLISHLECPLVAENGMQVTGRRSVKTEGRQA